MQKNKAHPDKMRRWFIFLVVSSLILILAAGVFISYVNIQSTIDPAFSSTISAHRDDLSLQLNLLGSRWTVDLSFLNSALGFLNGLPFLIPSCVRLLGQGISYLCTLLHL